MVIRKAYQFRLKTNSMISQALARTAGCTRLVWNKALALQKKRLDRGESCLGYSALNAKLTDWKTQPELAFLCEVHSQPLQQSLKDLDRAIRDAFDPQSPKRFPRFKKKAQHESFRYPQGFKLDGRHIYLPKIGWVRFYKSRDIEGVPKNVTVSRRGSHWYIAIQVEQTVAEPMHPATSLVGIDLGVARFAALSNGAVYEPLNSFRKLEKRLAREQQKLARKVKFSRNWHKQKARVARLHARIADARTDYLHKVSTEVSQNHAVVVLENLKVGQMSASARGTVEAPGRNVAAKAGLNKAILDQGWYEFRRQLSYKQQWRGGQVVLVDPRNTSRICPACGHIAAENRTTQAQFTCVDCRFEENADLVAAINIARAGHARLACGEVASAPR